MNDYLIPANANRGRLILGFFRKIDLIIFGSGCATTLILLLIFQGVISNTWTAIAILAPVAVTGFLVIPVPNQHNVLVVLINIYKFYFVDRRRYIWRGWCCLNDKTNK